MALRYPLDDHDVMVYTLDEASGVFTNSSTSPNKPASSDMTLYNSVTRSQPGVFGTCCLFPGSSSSRLDTAGPLYNGRGLFPSGLSMSCWIYLTGWGQTYASYFQKTYRSSGWSSPWGNAGFQHVDPQNTGTWYGKIAMDDGAGNPVDFGVVTTAGNLIPLNTWTYLGLSYNLSVFKIFMNGRLINQANETRAPIFGDGAWHVGSSPESGNQGMAGYVDECRVCDVGRPDSYFQDVWGYYKAQYGSEAVGTVKYFYGSTVKSTEGAAPIADVTTQPAVSRNWQFSVNNAVLYSGTRYNDRRNLLLGIKNAFIGFALHPWTVRRSSNSVTVANSDTWSTMADVNWNTSGSAHSWIVLRQTGLGASFEICIDCVPGSVDGGQIYIYASHFGYDLTTGSATARPTALGLEHTLKSSGGWAGATTTNYSFRYHVMQSADGQSTRVAICMNKIMQGFWLFDVAGAVELTDKWPEPAVFVVQGAITDATNAGSYAWWNDQALLFARPKIFSGWAEMRLYMGCEGMVAGMLGEQSYGPNELSGKYDIIPVSLISLTDNMRGRHGVIKDLWWGGVAAPNGLLLPEGTTKKLVQFGHLVMPWDGSSNVLVS